MLAKCLYVTNTTANLTIRGGFAGTESTADEREGNRLSTLDGGDTVSIMDAYSTKAVAFDQLRCTRGKTRAIRLPNSGATFTGCRFIDNGMTITNVANGLGVCIEKESTTASFTDCTFLGNRATNNFATPDQFYGGAVYLGDWTVGNFDNCLFVSNGLDFAVSSSNTKCAGAAIRAWRANLTLKNCRFYANRAAATGTNGGGIVNVADSSGEPVSVENCVFAGNECTYAGSDTNTGSGALNVGSSATTAITVKNCTFAYNFGDHSVRGPAISAGAGTNTIVNCIFHCNYTTPRNGGLGKAVYGGSVVNVSYSYFDGDPSTTAYINGATVVNLGDGIKTGDPRLVTREADLPIPTIANGAKYPASEWAKFANINAHLAGWPHYDENTGELVSPGGTKSDAIDAGDPASDYSKEPKPNGGRVNMGAWGNTPHAAMTSSRPGLQVIVR